MAPRIENAGDFSFQNVEEDVLMLLCLVDSAKATDLDGFSARMLNMAAPGISKV